MKFARPILWALAGLAALLLLAGIVVTQLVDADRFRPTLVERLEAATGRRVELADGIRLDWFPWLALETGAGSIGNPPGMSGEPLARWESLRIGARLMPLLRGRLELDRIEARGLRLRLVRDASGRASYENFGAPRPAGAAPAAPPAIAALGGIALRDGRIDWIDEVAGTRVALAGVDLEVGAWRAGAPFDLRLRFDLLGERPVPIALRTRLVLQPDPLAPRRIDAQDLRLEVSLPGEGDARLETRTAVPSLRLDVEPLRVLVPAASVRVPAADGELGLRELSAGRGESGFALDAAFELAPRFSLKKLVTALGGEAPRTRDPAALGALGASGRLRYAPDDPNVALRIEPLALSIDGAALAGSVTRAADADSIVPPIEFALRGEAFDLTRYLEPADVVGEPFEFPTETLKALRARGALQIERVTLADLDLRGVTLRLELAEGRVDAEGATR